MAMHSSGTEGSDAFVAGDESGCVRLWSSADCKELLASKSTGYPIVSIGMSSLFVAAGYSTGHVRVFRRDDLSLAAEVAAHAKCITGLAMHPTLPQFTTVSEDTTLNVWGVTGGSDELRLDLECHVKEADFMFTGVQYSLAARPHILATAFDSTWLKVLFA
jgi:WD40 repeat protein